MSLIKKMKYLIIHIITDIILRTAKIKILIFVSGEGEGRNIKFYIRFQY